MKTTNLKTAAAILIIATTTTLSANAFHGNRTNGISGEEKAQVSCIYKISGLTADQTNTITALETEHQKTMDALRTERRATTDEKTKAEVRIKMIDQRDSHRAEVKKLLTPEQKLAYDALHASGNNHQYANAGKHNGTGNGNRSGNGNGRNNMKGNGNGSGNGNHHGGCRR